MFLGDTVKQRFNFDEVPGSNLTVVGCLICYGFVVVVVVVIVVVAVVVTRVCILGLQSLQ